MTAYTYQVVRYVHDPASGEALNVGVILYAPEQPFIGFRIERRYERLSKAYTDFDGDHYRRSIMQCETAFDRLRDIHTSGLHKMWSQPPSVDALVAQVWPDTGLSFQLGPVLAGITNDPEVTLNSVFYSMVTAFYDRPHSERRSDDDIWAVYREPLIRNAANKPLKPHRFSNSMIEMDLEHVFKNTNYHALVPLSMDYARADNIRDKAARWQGNAVALSESSDLKKLYLLLGPPQLEGHRVAYQRAKNLLNKMPIEHQLVEEDGADDFAVYLADYMKQHGVTPEPSDDDR